MSVALFGVVEDIDNHIDTSLELTHPCSHCNEVIVIEPQYKRYWRCDACDAHFHIRCIHKLAIKSDRCPQCGLEIPPRDMTDIYRDVVRFCAWAGDVVSTAFFLDEMIRKFGYPRRDALNFLRATTRGLGYSESVAPVLHAMGLTFTRAPQATYDPVTRRHTFDSGFSEEQAEECLRRLAPAAAPKANRQASVLVTVLRDARDAGWMSEDGFYFQKRTRAFVSGDEFGVQARLVDSLDEALARVRDIQPRLLVVMGHGTSDSLASAQLNDVRTFLGALAEVEGVEGVVFHACDLGQSAAALCSGARIHVGMYTNKIIRKPLEHVGVYCNTMYAIAHVAALCDPSASNSDAFAHYVRRALVDDALQHTLRYFDPELGAPSAMDMIFASAMCGLRSDLEGDAFVFYSPTQTRVMRVTQSV
jgi:hypothetical protein